MHRSMVDADRRFVASSWAKSYSFSHWAGPWHADDYWPLAKKTIDAILDKPATRVLVSCNPTDKEQIFGWACYEPGDIPTLHYVYLKHVYRDHKEASDKPHLAIAMLREIGMADGRRFNFTFRTAAWDRYRQHWRLNAHFAPEIVRGYAKGKEAR